MRKIIFVMLVGVLFLAACGGSGSSSSSGNENATLAPVPEQVLAQWMAEEEKAAQVASNN